MSAPACTCAEDGWCPVHHVQCTCADPNGLCLPVCVCADTGVRDAVDEHKPCDCRERAHAEAQEDAWNDAANDRVDRDVDDDRFDSMWI